MWRRRSQKTPSGVPAGRPSISASYDAIVIGGGHNGLVAAAYLARAGMRTVVLETRPNTGGAATTETPWGPEFKVTALSYVMSLMPPTIIRDLKLDLFGYKVVPMGPSFVAFDDTRSVLLTEDAATDHDEIAAISARDAQAMHRYEAWLRGVGDVLSPLLLRTPPNLGSMKSGDLLDQLRLAWGMRGLKVRGAADAVRLFTMSIADVLAEWFDTDEIKGVMAINGIIGTWAGPESPGTAYVMMHHTIGSVDGAGDDRMGAWGYPIGGMGAVSASIRASAEALGATVLTESPVAKILVRKGRVTGVATADGREFRARTVLTAVHPKITFLRQLDRAELPDDFVTDIERWRTRSGVVKVNLALAGLPRFTARPDLTPAQLSGAVELAPSLSYLEQAFTDAMQGRGAERPFADSVIPSILDPTLCPPGTHVMSMFTQWVPHTWAAEPHEAELKDYADRVIGEYERLAPGFEKLILHRQVIGPYEMEHDYGLIGGNIFHGELSTDQLFHLRPAPGYADFTTPIRGLYQCSSATHGGGGVTGIAGYLCSQRVIKDRRR